MERVIADRFELLGEAGAGGIGRVYRAHDRVHDAVVALKVLTVSDPADVERFHRESQLLSGLAHPGIVRYVAHGIASGGRPYLAMEWLDGEDLGRRLRRAPLSMPEATELMARVSEALGAAHRAGVIHRDIKPTNIFLVNQSEKTPKILDFGIAKSARSSTLGAGDALTLTGSIIGTPGYMAPEQARGRSDIDARADVFSLGCVLYRCISGQRPFEGDDLFAVLMKVATQPVRRLSEIRRDVPAALDELIGRTLSKEPADRPADGLAFAEALRRLGPLDGPAAPTSDAPAISTTERRLISLLVGRFRARAPGVEVSSESAEASRTALLEAEANRAQGRLELQAGPAFLIVLSTEGGPQELALRAARCAMRLRAADADLQLCIVSGRGGNAQGALSTATTAGAAVSELIDRASTLLDQAGEDPAVVDGSTAVFLEGRFNVVRRNKPNDSERFALKGQRPAEQTRLFLGRPSPCVGRERELAALVGLYQECVEDEVARVGLITGTAGIGKSRLRYELFRRIADDSDPAPLILVARGDQLHAGASFGIVGQLVGQAVAIGRSEGSSGGAAEGSLAFARTAERIRAVLGPTTPGYMASLLWTLGGGASDELPDNQREEIAAASADEVRWGDQLRDAWLKLLAALSRSQPVALVVEDLHWADRGSVELLDASLRALSEKTLFVLGLGRNEVHDRFPRLWTNRFVQEIRLAELSTRAAKRLARTALGDGATDEVVDDLVARAAGNAFYLEELIRAVSQGQGSALPDTILALAQARLDEVGPEGRRVLRAASVFGRSFRAAGVAALLGQPKREEQTKAWLNMLIDQELITMRGFDVPTTSGDGHVHYAFRHALLREAAYASLPVDEAKRAHARAAAWLEKQPDASATGSAAMLAEHWERADQPPRAAFWNLRTAEQALAGNDFDGAAHYALRGAQQATEPWLRGELWLRAARAMSFQQDRHGARHAAESALVELSSAEGPSTTASWFAAGGELALLHASLGEHESLASLAERLVARPAERASEGVVEGLAKAAFALHALGDKALSKRARDRIDQIATASNGIQSFESIAARARAEQAAALGAIDSGDAEAYLKLSRQAADSFDQAGDIRTATTQRANVAFSLRRLGRPKEAAEVSRRVYADADRLGLGLVATSAEATLGAALVELGDVNGGLLRVQRAAQRAQEAGARAQASTLAYLARALLAAGDAVEAIGAAAEAARLSEAIAPVHILAVAARAHAELAAGNAEAALASATEAVTQLDKLGALDEGEMLARLALIRALEASGHREKAAQERQRARQLLTERASRIRDESLRESLLTGVSEHREILASA